MNAFCDTNQTASSGEGVTLDPAEAAKILEQSERRAPRQIAARARLAANTEALRSLLNEVAP